MPPAGVVSTNGYYDPVKGKIPHLNTYHGNVQRLLPVAIHAPSGAAMDRTDL
jgi:hypothetical protein